MFFVKKICKSIQKAWAPQVLSPNETKNEEYNINIKDMNE